MNLNTFIQKYFLPPENVIPQNRCFSATHIIISTILFYLIAVIFSDIAINRNKDHSRRVLKLCAWLMLALEVFRISWNWYFHGLSLTCFRFDFCNQICMFLPFCIILGNEKIYPYIQLLSIIGGLCVLIYPLWVFYDYAGFHIMALQSMVSHALMLLSGLIMPYASGKIPSPREETRDTLIGFSVILVVACTMSYTTGVNYFMMRSADGIPLLSLIPFPWYWAVFLVIFFFFVKPLSMIYTDFLCLSAHIPLGSTDLYNTKTLSKESYLELVNKEKQKLYRFFRPFKYKKLLKTGGHNSEDS